jgi:hypothetical protein
MGVRIGLLRGFRVAIIIPVILFVLPLFAFAGGGQQYPNGAEAMLIGVAPPPGFYLKDYNFFYHASKLKDNDGNTLSLAKNGVELDKLEVFANIPRFIWISKLNLLGGFYGMHLFVPLMIKENLDLNVLTPGGPGSIGERRAGIGNLIFAPFIWTWHAKSGLLHMISALDIFIPTGQYNKNNLLNIGKNFWTFEPVFAITGFLPQHPNLSGSIKLMYDFNTKNNDFLIDPTTAAKIGNPALAGLGTDLTPGQEFHFDYSIEYALTKNFRAGIVGYFYQQTTNDDTDFGKVENDKGRTFAIGPGFWYNYQRWFFDLHAAFETATKNRPQGYMGLFAITYCF